MIFKGVIFSVLDFKLRTAEFERKRIENLTAEGFQTNYDENIGLECPYSYITQIESEYMKSRGDRMFNVACSAREGRISQNQCSWSNLTNRWDEVLYYTCPDEGVVTGMMAYHENYYEDRVWMYKCCKVHIVLETRKKIFFTQRRNRRKGCLVSTTL